MIKDSEVIILDVDSTCVTIEGIDFLAGEKGIDVSKLTKLGMKDPNSFEEIYKKRLEMIRPSMQDVIDLGNAYVNNKTDGLDAFIASLKNFGKKIILVSGGIFEAVEILAKDLGVDEFYAVPLYFDDGKYLGYNENDPLSKKGGKIQIIKRLKEKYSGKFCFLGDGATDLEAKDQVDHFILFKGVVDRGLSHEVITFEFPILRKKLFIPGPVEVSEDTLKACSKPMIGHRTKEFQALYDSINMRLCKMLNAETVFLGACSATGLWEAAIRNCIKDRGLFFVNGAFSNKWYDAAIANGKDADFVNVEWGKPITPELVLEVLQNRKYDCVAIVHNETSTGVQSDLARISEVMMKYPDIIFAVDAVSSMSAVPIDVSQMGIDICLASVQKAFACPPGLAVMSVSEKALEKSKNMKDKGYYFDFETFLKYHNKSQTISTPPIPQMFALDHQLKKFEREGLNERYNRHKTLKKLVHTWAISKGFELFAEKGYESDTLTCIKNTKHFDPGKLRKYLISNGYGKLKDKTFRIAHMGDTSLDEMKELLDEIDEVIKN